MDDVTPGHPGPSSLGLTPTPDRVTGMVVVDRAGIRLGVVEDVVDDVGDDRAQHICVVSGGVLGLATSRTMVPVGAIMRIDDRVRVDLARGSGPA